jgi:hypothetical protein
LSKALELSVAGTAGSTTQAFYIKQMQRINLVAKVDEERGRGY